MVRKLILRHVLIAAVLAVLVSAGLWYLLGAKWTWISALTSWLLGVNALTFAYYGYDKIRSTAAEGRIPEIVLHGLASCGGSPAALAAMHLFRHKTVKGSFRILFWCIVALQIALLVWLVKNYL